MDFVCDKNEGHYMFGVWYLKSFERKVQEGDNTYLLTIGKSVCSLMLWLLLERIINVHDVYFVVQLLVIDDCLTNDGYINVDRDLPNSRSLIQFPYYVPD